MKQTCVIVILPNFILSSIEFTIDELKVHKFIALEKHVALIKSIIEY